MSDIVDMASDIEAENLARSLAAARVAVPPGVAGECEACGDHSQRLIGGRCAPCRDGRMRTVAVRDVVAAPSITIEREEPESMPNPPPTADRRQISVPASGIALKAILEHADTHELPLGQAALALIEIGASALLLPPPAPSAAPAPEPVRDSPYQTALVAWLDGGGDLDGFLSDLFARVGSSAEADALRARAEDAEGKLAVVREAMAA